MERTSGFGHLFGSRSATLAVVLASAVASVAVGATSVTAAKIGFGTVLQTNLVSDLPGVATVLDPNLVNPWGISESSASPFWISDNNAGVATLYTAVSKVGLVVSIPTPPDATGGGTPTGTVFNIAGAGTFPVAGVDHNNGQTSAKSIFLFATEDGTIAGWNPGVNPQGFDPGKAGTYAIVAVDNSGNNFTNQDPNQETGAVYKGMAIAASNTPIIASDANSTALVYASNFRAGSVDVFDTQFSKVTALPSGAFTDPDLPDGYAPFNVQVLNGKVYVSFALQNDTRHDDVAGKHNGFVDTFNLDGTPGLPDGQVRLISGGVLDSPWGLAIAPTGFAGLSAGTDPVLLVGNFGDGFIHAFDAATGDLVGQLTDPDGESIQIDGLWALKVGNGGNGGLTNTVYFTAGLFGETHGLFGSLATIAPGSPEGPAEAQWVQANLDIVQLDQDLLAKDIASGAPEATIDRDQRTLEADSHALAGVQRAFADDSSDDAGG